MQVSGYVWSDEWECNYQEQQRVFPFRLADLETRNLGGLLHTLKKPNPLKVSIPWPVRWVYGTVMITRECTKMSPAKSEQVRITLVKVERRISWRSYRIL